MKTINQFSNLILIDDDLINNFYNEEFLKSEFQFENDLQTFDDSEAALNFLQEKRFDSLLLLIDINMPLMTGFEFISKYQETENFNKNTVICMLTSSLHSKDQELAAKYSNIRFFLKKPLLVDNFQEFLDTL